MIVLETERLHLRQLTTADAPFILELVNEPAWLEFIGDRGVRTLDDARGYLTTGPVAMYARLGFGLWAVERKSDGVAVGICGLLKRDTLPDVDLGYALLQRHWGQGYAHEAAAAALAHGRHTLKLPRIVAITAPVNERSTRLLEKMGFRFERMIAVTEGKPESRLYVPSASAAALA